MVQLKNGSSYHKGDEFIAGEWYEGGNDTFQAAYKGNCEWYGKSTEEAKAAWFEKKKKLAAQREKDKKEGRNISESSSSSDNLEAEPKADDKSPPSKKKGDDPEGSKGTSKSPVAPVRVSKKDHEVGKKRGSGESSSEDETKKSNKRNPLSISSDNNPKLNGKRSSKDRELKPLSWFAQKFGGPTAREAIVAATGLEHTASPSETPGTPKQSGKGSKK